MIRLIRSDSRAGNSDMRAAGRAVMRECGAPPHAKRAVLRAIGAAARGGGGIPDVAGGRASRDPAAHPGFVAGAHRNDMEFSANLSASLRAKRSNPESHKGRLDCRVARAPRNDGEGFPVTSPRHCERRRKQLAMTNKKGSGRCRPDPFHPATIARRYFGIESSMPLT